jgi:O-6-methylguanine DNA methyltransferase
MIIELVKVGNLPGYLAILRNENSKINGTHLFFCKKFTKSFIMDYLNRKYEQNFKFIERELDIASISIDDLDESCLSSYQKKVYRKLVKIKAGNQVYYSDLLGVKHARSVGTAMMRNPFPLVIPCHRVTSKSNDRRFSISCYACKPDSCINEDVNKCAIKMKQSIIDFENEVAT